MKKVELIAVGDELLSGKTVNTNFSFLGKKFREGGFSVSFGQTVPDVEESIVDAITSALKRSDIVLLTGGLGPTEDDRTLPAALKVFPSEMIRHDGVAEAIAKRYGKDLPVLEQQASVPKGAEVFVNPVGTAPALLFSKNEKSVALLPGVPHELERLFTELLLPFLIEKYPQKEKEYEESFSLCLLHEGQVDPFLRKLIAEYPQVSFGIYPAYGTLRVHLHSYDQEQLEKAARAFSNGFDEYIFTQEDRQIKELLHEHFLKCKGTLSFAESCTGGNLAAEITSMSGCSEYFLGSCVTYANALKQEILGVKEETLRTYGAVSEQTVREMISGLFSRTQSDYGIAISGIAGPTGATPDKPVGTMWAAIGKRGEEPFIGHFVLKGDRRAIVDICVQQLFAHLWRWIAKEIEPFSR